jgi:hypothetical protein
MRGDSALSSFLNSPEFEELYVRYGFMEAGADLAAVDVTDVLVMPAGQSVFRLDQTVPGRVRPCRFLLYTNGRFAFYVLQVVHDEYELAQMNGLVNAATLAWEAFQ